MLVHNDLPPERFEGNRLLNRMFGAESLFIGETTEEERSLAVDRLAADLRAHGERPYVIENGVSTPIGVLGYVNAARELFESMPSRGWKAFSSRTCTRPRLSQDWLV